MCEEIAFGGWAAVQQEGDHNRLEQMVVRSSANGLARPCAAWNMEEEREADTEALTLPVGGNAGPIWGAGVSG